MHKKRDEDDTSRNNYNLENCKKNIYIIKSCSKNNK